MPRALKEDDDEIEGAGEEMEADELEDDKEEAGEVEVDAPAEEEPVLDLTKREEPEIDMKQKCLDAEGLGRLSGEIWLGQEEVVKSQTDITESDSSIRKSTWAVSSSRFQPPSSPKREVQIQAEPEVIPVMKTNHTAPVEMYETNPRSQNLNSSSLPSVLKTEPCLNAHSASCMGSTGRSDLRASQSGFPKANQNDWPLTSSVSDHTRGFLSGGSVVFRKKQKPTALPSVLPPTSGSPSKNPNVVTINGKQRQTHPGCTTIKYNYNRKNNEEYEKRRIHYCDFPGNTNCLHLCV